MSNCFCALVRVRQYASQHRLAHYDGIKSTKGTSNQKNRYAIFGAPEPGSFTRVKAAPFSRTLPDFLKIAAAAHQPFWSDAILGVATRTLYLGKRALMIYLRLYCSVTSGMGMSLRSAEG